MTSLLQAARPRVGFALVLLITTSSAVEAQTSSARVDVRAENFRREANGRILATVFRGAELGVVRQSGRWIEAEIDGWIWSASVGPTRREGHDLVVTADGGENLRAAPGPQARILARLLEGFLLDRVESEGDWVRVRRRGWVWGPSLEIGPAEGDPAAGDAGSVSDAASGPDADGADAGVLTAPAPLDVHARPDGDTIATLRAGRRARIVGRAGDWLRVRVDGWIYAPAALDTAVALEDTGDLMPAQLRAEPARYRGALVRWRVQFISLRNAEPVRTDFEEGEPFIQARGPAGDPGFVYLAVPDELLEIARRLEPLDHMTVVGRVRTGRSTLTGTPIIDLTEIETTEITP